MVETIRVAVVDDHPMMREGVVHTIIADDEFDIVGEGASATDAVALVRAHAPDVIVLDINMPGGGIEAAIEIGALNGQTKIIMLTVSEDDQHVSEALLAGAKGYILKGVSGAELIRSIKAIVAGECYVSPNLAARLLGEAKGPAGQSAGARAEAANPLEQLSFREDQILQFVAEGKSNKQIGELLELSEQTIKHYVSAILQKLDVKNRVEAAVMARRLK